MSERVQKISSSRLSELYIASTVLSEEPVSNMCMSKSKKSSNTIKESRLARQEALFNKYKPLIDKLPND